MCVSLESPSVIVSEDLRENPVLFSVEVLFPLWSVLLLTQSRPRTTESRFTDLTTPERRPKTD